MSALALKCLFWSNNFAKIKYLNSFGKKYKYSRQNNVELSACIFFSKYYVRGYHSSKGVYGFKRRQPIPFSVSKEALRNRIENGSIYQLATAYRDHGHKLATLNPLDKVEIENIPELDPSRYGLSIDNQDIIALDGIFYTYKPTASIDEIIKMLKKTYCGYIGVEFQYLCENEKEWFANELEKMQIDGSILSDERKSLAIELLKSQVFDNFLATKFSTVKRYGGEGAESMMGFFQEVFRKSCLAGISDVIIGIPHRGRLNLLTGMLKFPPVAMFQKMKGLPEFPSDVSSSGDVLSHLTSSVDLEYEGKTVHVTLLPNPSHLEVVSPVVVGNARSRQQSLRLGDYSEEQNMLPAANILPIQVHGDASFAGQGIIMETVAMSSVPHFSVGGCVHLIVNNQLGFTTPHDHGRSSVYCSDIMKMISVPVIHVNGDFPEELIKATRLAFSYRQTFQKDVLIDLNCFRRWGHNEMDDPTFTNPAMYNIINARKSVPDLYSEMLIEEDLWDNNEKQRIISDYNSFLNGQLQEVGSYKPEYTSIKKQWKGLVQAPKCVSKWDTGIPINLSKFIGAKSVTVPDSMTIHPHLQKVFVNERHKRLDEGTRIDWATAESLAIGSLLYQGHNVRLSGQDVGRGTFSHRHAMLVDQVTDEIYVPLNHIINGQTAFYEVANSILSEEGVLGFEYGFSVENPNNLVIWEAQFGDFFNAAQVIFDTCISSGETKWLLQCGIVILLPHGYDGAGPEHSSCRLERFLQMCDSREDSVDGDDVNWYIMHPTTPAQYFHLLRRQIVCNYRKPLVVASPKVLLRLPQAVSSLEDMAPGTTFNPVIGDNFADVSKVKKIIFCSGKHFYLLQKEREIRNATDTVIIRLEALCPFPVKEISDELQKYKNAQRFIWSQEEQQNMGAWCFVKPRFENLLNCKLKYAGRGPLATPAVGVGQLHQQEIQTLINRTFE